MGESISNSEGHSASSGESRTVSSSESIGTSKGESRTIASSHSKGTSSTTSRTTTSPVVTAGVRQSSLVESWVDGGKDIIPIASNVADSTEDKKDAITPDYPALTSSFESDRSESERSWYNDQMTSYIVQSFVISIARIIIVSVSLHVVTGTIAIFFIGSLGYGILESHQFGEAVATAKSIRVKFRALFHGSNSTTDRLLEDELRSITTQLIK